MAASASAISARNQAKARIYDSLATAAPTRIAYVLPTALRSHAGTPRAADRHLVRPGRGPDPAVRAAGGPASTLRQSLSRDRSRFLAGADVRCAQRCGARFVPASLHGMGV